MTDFSDYDFSDYKGFIETDPDPFPADDANSIVEAGAQLDVLKVGVSLWGVVGTGGASLGLLVGDSFETGVIKTCDKVLELVGNWSVARNVASEWVRLAGVPEQVKEELEDSYGVMVKYWDGGAFKSFTEYHDAVVDKLDATTTAMADISEEVTSLIGVVFKSYADAAGFLISCAAECARVFEPWAWVDAIAGFIEKVGDLVKASIETMGSFVELAAKIAADKDLFPVLPERDGTRNAFSAADEWGLSQAPGNG